MKDRRIGFMGMLTVVLAFGLVFAGCPVNNEKNEDGIQLKGTTWVVAGSDIEGEYIMTYTFTASGYTMTYVKNGRETTRESGSYSVAGNTVKFIDEDNNSFTGNVSGNTMTIGNYTLQKQ